jgi:hypothetical protein
MSGVQVDVEAEGVSLTAEGNRGNSQVIPDQTLASPQTNVLNNKSAGRPPGLLFPREENNIAGIDASNPKNPIFDNLVWLNSREAADYLRKSPGAIRIHVHRGHIKAHKWYRRLYFRKADLDRLLMNPSQGGF